MIGIVSYISALEFLISHRSCLMKAKSASLVEHGVLSMRKLTWNAHWLEEPGHPWPRASRTGSAGVGLAATRLAAEKRAMMMEAVNFILKAGNELLGCVSWCLCLRLDEVYG
jgi:hypothetical protein